MVPLLSILSITRDFSSQLPLHALAMSAEVLDYNLDSLLSIYPDLRRDKGPWGRRIRRLCQYVNPLEVLEEGASSSR